MRVSQKNLLFCLILVAAGSMPVHAQLGFDLTIKKPEPYEERQLKAEKTGDKKLKLPSRAFQNATTHYNYFFNANQRINEIIDRAKASFRENYTTLLPFYNYELEVTQADSVMLDSVIYKSKTGIVLHDLRNDWIDNLYLLWGAAYYLQKDFDSAGQMFQFINYAFAEKEKDGYYRYIGSRTEGSNTINIATKENDNLAKRALSEPPSRNDALIWQIRNMIQQDIFAESGSLIATLKNDPHFPKRLNSDLEEVQALWFYKQQMWDSSARHLVRALDNAKKGQERARWEFLAAQMFERKELYEDARVWYNKAIGHSTDPVLEVYARLNLIRVNKQDDKNIIDKNIAELMKMARRDKYMEYRDIIYSMAARMELERNNFFMAQEYLAKSAKFRSGNQIANNDAYLELADLTFAQHNYASAAFFYDSVKTESIQMADADRVTTRKAALASWTNYTNIIYRQDSLQRLAAMTEDERDAQVSKVFRQLRRLKGLKEDEALPRPLTPLDPFASQQSKGEWYFYNDALKRTGEAAFRQAWGNRPNVDNWRRQSDVSAQLRNNIPNVARTIPKQGAIGEDVLSAEGLYANIPLTPEQLKISNDSIQFALFNLGRLYVTTLDDLEGAITTFENIRTRYPQADSMAAVLFYLHYAYTRTGNEAKAAEMKRLLSQLQPGNRYATIINTGVDPLSTRPSDEVTKAYENIYDMFIAGRFEEAAAAKKMADEKYSTTYWSPQLLYIESVHYIRQRQDSIARTLLSTLITQNPGTAIAAKAENLLQVLARRTQIENELGALQIERPKEDTLVVEPMPVAKNIEKKDIVPQKPKDSLQVKQVPVIAKNLPDSALRKPVIQKAAGSPYVFNGTLPHYVMIVLTGVDPVYINEAKNAIVKHNREKYRDQALESRLQNLNDQVRLLLVGNFNDAASAIDYISKTKPLAPTHLLPWLKADKYVFSIISEENLQAMLKTQDFNEYRKFLDTTLPVKF